MKQFHISDVLSVTTPFLLSTRHVDGIYDILGFLCREQGGLFTHQLPRVNEEVQPWLRTQFPQLMADSPEMVPLIEKFQVDVEAPEADRKKVCEDFVETVRVKWGLPEYLSVYEMGADMHTHIDPIEEAKAMMGDDRVIVVPAPSREDRP